MKYLFLILLLIALCACASAPKKALASPATQEGPTGLLGPTGCPAGHPGEDATPYIKDQNQ